jgi:hypothetical protein
VIIFGIKTEAVQVIDKDSKRELASFTKSTYNDHFEDDETVEHAAFTVRHRDS